MWMRRHIAVKIGAVLFLLASALGREREAAPLSAVQFANLIQRISEDSGYFWNENYVSNEASYLHPLKRMRELGIHGGIYIGVGPNQNFTYIAKLHPRYAFIVDIRRQNLLEHLLFKALFHIARDRKEFLSLLLSRPITHGSFTRDNYTVEDLVGYFRKAPPDPYLYHRTQARIRVFLSESCRVPLSDQDWRIIEKVHRAFFARGLYIKYDYIPVPDYGDFLTEKDLDGNMENDLNSPQDFHYLKRLEEENRIIPVTGDFAGEHALREIGQYLTERNEKVTVFYTSNVEQYLIRNMVWPRFLKNLGELPLDDHAVFIRAYWGNFIPHPEGINGYRFTQILQMIRPFLQDFNPRMPYSYWDIVTTDTIRLH